MKTLLLYRSNSESINCIFEYGKKGMFDEHVQSH